jgi:hypothetical protein
MSTFCLVWIEDCVKAFARTDFCNSICYVGKRVVLATRPKLMKEAIEDRETLALVTYENIVTTP